MYNRNRKPRILIDASQQPVIGLACPLSGSQRTDRNEMNWLDVSEIAIGTGLNTKVAISVALSDGLTPIATEFDGDYDQRLWDALWMAHFKLYVDQSLSATFNFAFQCLRGKAKEISEVNLRLHAEVKDDLTQLGLLEDF